MISVRSAALSHARGIHIRIYSECTVPGEYSTVARDEAVFETFELGRSNVERVVGEAVSLLRSLRAGVGTRSES